MSILKWVKLFGKTGFDPATMQELRSHGIEHVPMVEKGRIESNVKVEDYNLIFRSEALFPELDEDVGEGVGVLVRVYILINKNTGINYEGELPFELSRSDRMRDVRNKLGLPLKSNDRRPWDEWEVKGYTLRVNYNKSNPDDLFVEGIAYGYSMS